jgi:hypothetical protein
MCPTSSKATLKVQQRGDIIVGRSALLSGHLFYKHMESLHQDTPLSRSSESSQKSAWKTNETLNPTSAASTKRNYPDLAQSPNFMHKYFEDVINVAGDGHFVFCAE